MKINKLYAGIALASTLILTGCGDDNDDNVSNPDNNGGPIVNNELNYSAFDSFTDVVNGEYKRGWGKTVYVIGNNRFSKTISTAVGSSPTAYQDSMSEYSNIEYYASKNTFVAVPLGSEGKFYKLRFTDDHTFNSSIYEGDSSINATYNIVTLDLNGVSNLPFNAKTGISTDLNALPEESAATFPAGSQCYILQETPMQSYYAFYDYDAGKNITIDEWIADQKQDNTVTDIIQEKVGRNNELPAARYKDEHGNFVSAIKYNGLLYDADYYQKGVTDNTVTDFTTNVVNCYLYNDVAAKFFETQIKANY